MPRSLQTVDRAVAVTATAAQKPQKNPQAQTQRLDTLKEDGSFVASPIGIPVESTRVVAHNTGRKVL